MPPTGKPVGAILQHFLPGKIAIVFDVVEEQARQLVELLTVRDEYRIRERDLSDTLLNDQLKEAILSTFEEVISEIDSNEVSTNVKSARSLSKVSSALEDLRNNFTLANLRESFSNLGPLRRELTSKLAEKSSDLQKIAKGNRIPEYTMMYSPLPDISEAAVTYTQYFFSRQVKYLGPLRDDPKPVYPLAGATDPKDVGFRGEHTAAVLDVHKNTLVEYIPSNNFHQGRLSRAPSKVTLVAAVLDWLSYMGIADNVTTRDRGKLGHELKVSTVGERASHDLTHVGVGVSQVLPILVLSLLADPGSTLIFEQPELHLHPRVQTRLADFFVSMTMINKQSIVETHSEYLINRLRYQVAVSDSDQLSKNVIMYFVEKDKGYSTYRPIKINQYGVIEDWPKGFFDENEENAASVLRAGMEKRKREMRKKDV